MSIASVQLPAALQTLIDTRLDTIDRMLLGSVPRQDRLAIVKEVEAQVFELLQGQRDDELSREDVLAILARLDPPEAYLPDEDDLDAPVPRPRSVAVPRVVSTARGGISKGAKAAAILGIGSFAMLTLSPLIYLFAVMLGNASEVLALVVLFGAAGVMLVGAVLAIVLGALNRRFGLWPVIGLVAGAATLLGPTSLGMVLLVMMSA